MANPNIKAPLRLPRPSLYDCSDPKLLKDYLDTVVRALDQNIGLLFNNNNNTWVINPSTTASRTSLSIAGDTVNLNKVRDNLTTLLYVLKNNNRVN